MKIPSGYSFYGQEVGVLVFRGKSPRIPGDAGHAGSFGYPVRYQIVDCGFMDLVKRWKSSARPANSCGRRESGAL